MHAPLCYFVSIAAAFLALVAGLPLGATEQCLSRKKSLAAIIAAAATPNALQNN